MYLLIAYKAINVSGYKDRPMKRGITGHFKTTIAGSESVRAFVPDPLPPVRVLPPARRRTPGWRLGDVGGLHTGGYAPDRRRRRGHRHRLLALFAENERRIRETGRAGGSAQRAFAVLRRRPLVTIDGIANGAGMTFPTASRAIDLLTNLQIVREMTGKYCNRVFAYDSYLAILNEGTQP
jgi:hypothetical protein